MANRLLTPAEFTQRVIASVNKQAKKHKLTARQRAELLYLAARSLAG